MEEQNGHQSPRMDRLERLMELVITDHVKFADEHNKLLTSQVLLTDGLDRLGKFVATSVQELRESQKATDARMKELAESQKHTDERMGVLIQMMDTFIRERGETKRGEK